MNRKKFRKLTLKMRLSLLLFAIAIPLTFMILEILSMIQNYSDSYNRIMLNLKIANEYNITFKEDMEYSMYRVMIGLIDASEFEDGDIVEGTTVYATVLKNPISMIDSARYAFGSTIERVPGTDGDIKIRGILSCLDTLETAVNRMIENSAMPGTYDENVSIWENDIKGLCSMMQEYITQYTYYELVHMEELQKDLEARTKQNIEIFIVLLLGILALGFSLSTMITKSVTIPIHSLQKTAQRLGSGELKARAEMYELEEINVLARTFNKMSDEIAELMEKTKQEQINLREAELKLLQAQINPHFLYNTLDSIVWMAEGGNSRQVVEMTTDLSDFFRTVLSGGNDYITIAEEEGHIRSYLKIQRSRYEDILDYDIDIEPAIKDRMILKMILQPIVENALYHGIKNKRGGGKITIRGYAADDGVLFEVEDNGSGMDAETLAVLRKKLQGRDDQPNSGKNSFGMYNVAQRIRMYYGSRSDITVTSQKGIGTCVRICLGRFDETNPKNTEKI
ncbi:MAG: sensor histidine kinase [Lachnospiraceae bacterium]